MRAILRNLGLMWRNVVEGKHRSGTRSVEEILAGLDWHESPLVGKYVRTKKGDSWWADAPLPGLDETVRLLAPGPEPVREQMAAFAEVVSRLPSLIEASKLESAPKNDGWGNSPPAFDMHATRISSLWIRDNGSYLLIFEVDPERVYLLSPCFEISADFELVHAEWSV